MKPKDHTTVFWSISSHTLPDDTKQNFSSLFGHLNTLSNLFVSYFVKKIEGIRKLFPPLPPHLPTHLHHLYPCTPRLSPGPHPLLPQNFFLTATVPLTPAPSFPLLLPHTHQLYIVCLYALRIYLFVCYTLYACNTSSQKQNKKHCPLI